MATAAVQHKAEADAAYRQGDYQKAITLYEKALTTGPSAAAHHNIGNAYYRVDNVPMAILHYEKARKLAPGDERIQHSLDIARGKTIDKLPQPSEMFFVRWYRTLQSLATVQQWTVTSLVAFSVALLLFLAYLFLGNIVVRRIAFYGSVSLILLFLVSVLFAWQRKSTLTTPDSAVIMTPEATVKQSPETKAPAACVIHEGTCVEITDTEMHGWYGIRLSDGREGWIKATDIEMI